MMQVCLYRHRSTKDEIQAAQFTGFNFLAMNTWTSERLKWRHVRRGTCLLYDPVDDKNHTVEMYDWIIKDADGHFEAVTADVFTRDYVAVTE